MPGPLESVIKEKVLQRLAGERAYQRGCELHQHAHVQPSEFAADLAAADVLDGATRSVTLTSEAGELDPACPCPEAEGGLLCEHGVATALAWLAWRKSGIKVKPVRKKKLTIEESLALLPPERLVRIILDVAAAHPLANAALQRCVAMHSTQGLDVAALRKSISTQLAAGGKTAIRKVPELQARVVQVERDIRQVMAGGNPYAALDLCEVALAQLIKLTRSMDRYWNDMIQCQARFEQLHADAAEAAHPPPVELAERIARLMALAAPAAAFANVGQTHGAALGEAGLRELQSLLPHNPLAINLNVSICESLGDTALMRRAIEAHPNPGASHYTALAELHFAQGNLPAAIQAAEDGMAKVRWDRHLLQKVLLPWIAAAQGAPAALERALTWFRKSPSVLAYRQLRETAAGLNCWPEWRAHMWEILKDGKTVPPWVAVSVVHAILIDDDNPGGALQLYRDRPNGEPDRLLDIATAYEPVNPHLATDLRFEHATQLVLEGRYPDAVASLCSAARRAEACDDSAYFHEEMRRFAALHNRKSTLVKLLRLNANALGLPGAQLA
ncbi:MAG TPA: hypothetical protein VGK29_07525 [Paludibaculum sp.]|jgi:hypothetical protein